MALVVFTIFGQGRLHRWTFVVEDKEGRAYHVDERSLQRSGPTACTFLLKRTSPTGEVQARFVLDFKACTLQKGAEEPQPILPGTVADDLRRQLAPKVFPP